MRVYIYIHTWLNHIYIYMSLSPLHSHHMFPRERQLAHEEAVRESQSWDGIEPDSEKHLLDIQKLLVSALV